MAVTFIWNSVLRAPAVTSSAELNGTIVGVSPQFGAASVGLKMVPDCTGKNCS